MKNVWIVATDGRIQELLDQVDASAWNRTVIAAGWTPAGAFADTVTVAVPAANDAPVEALAPAVVRALPAAAGDIIIVQDSAAGRVLAGALAANLDAPIAHGLVEVTPEVAKVSRYGGLVTQSRALDTTAVLVGEGATEAATTGEAVTVIEDQGFVATVTDEESAANASVDLGAAKRVVGIGRGLKEQEDLALVEAFAAALDAEVACSRPLAEGQNWLGRDRYLGVSGRKISPEVYIAAGISGEIQHMAGVRGAQRIVAINNDKNAPIFNECDFGIVGDLYEILPALTAELEG